MKQWPCHQPISRCNALVATTLEPSQHKLCRRWKQVGGEEVAVALTHMIAAVCVVLANGSSQMLVQLLSELSPIT